MTLKNDEIRMTAEALRDVYGAMETNDGAVTAQEEWPQKGTRGAKKRDPDFAIFFCAFLRPNAFLPHEKAAQIFGPHPNLLFAPILPDLAEILGLRSRAVDDAEFGPKNRPVKIYAGYSDQGIFNAILHFKRVAPLVLDNDLVSQHWVHGKDKVEWRDGVFWNKGRRQIAFHSVGKSPKFWTPDYPK